MKKLTRCRLIFIISILTILLSPIVSNIIINSYRDFNEYIFETCRWQFAIIVAGIILAWYSGTKLFKENE